MYYTNNSRELYRLLVDNGYKPIGEGYSRTFKYVLVLPTKEINQVEYFKNSVDWYIKEYFSEYSYIKPEEYINYKGLQRVKMRNIVVKIKPNSINISLNGKSYADVFKDDKELCLNEETYTFEEFEAIYKAFKEIVDKECILNLV